MLIFPVSPLLSLFFLFVLMLKGPVNSNGHVQTVSSLNHTFFLGKFVKGLSAVYDCGIS